MQQHELCPWSSANLTASLQRNGSPVGVRNTFPPQFSASNESSPPADPYAGGAGVSLEVIAWMPCNVPARMRMVLSGRGGRVSACQYPLTQLRKTPSKVELRFLGSNWTCQSMNG